jgi:hypothetical protein
MDEGYLRLELHAEVLNHLDQGFDYVGFLLLRCHVDHRACALNSQLILSCHRVLPPLDEE